MEKKVIIWVFCTLFIKTLAAQETFLHQKWKSYFSDTLNVTNAQITKDSNYYKSFTMQLLAGDKIYLETRDLNYKNYKHFINIFNLDQQLIAQFGGNDRSANFLTVMKSGKHTFYFIAMDPLTTGEIVYKISVARGEAFLKLAEESSFCDEIKFLARHSQSNFTFLMGNELKKNDSGFFRHDFKTDVKINEAKYVAVDIDYEATGLLTGQQKIKNTQFKIFYPAADSLAVEQLYKKMITDIIGCFPEIKLFRYPKDGEFYLEIQSDILPEGDMHPTHGALIADKLFQKYIARFNLKKLNENWRKEKGVLLIIE